jgi:hypothetical protein
VAEDSTRIPLKIEWLNAEDTRPRRCNLEAGYCGELPVVRVIDEQKRIKRVLCLEHGHEYADRYKLAFPEGQAWAPPELRGPFIP